MDMLDELKAYKHFVKQNPYVYTLQKQGIDLLYSFLKSIENERGRSLESDQYIDYFLAVWVPKHKKYLADTEAFNIVYAVQDFLDYIEDKGDVEEVIPIVLDLYKETYGRVYNARKLIREMIGDPIISVEPSIIHLEKYREYKERQQKRDSMCMYEQGLFSIDEVNKDGYLSLSKVSGGKYCKVLCRPQLLKYFKEKDMMHISLKKKIFFIYWEIEEIKAYYPEAAARYLH